MPILLYYIILVSAMRKLKKYGKTGMPLGLYQKNLNTPKTAPSDKSPGRSVGFKKEKNAVYAPLGKQTSQLG